MTIRQADIADLERIAILFGQLGYPNDAGQLAEKLAASLGDATMQVVVADADGTITGVAVVHVMAPLHVPAHWALLSALVVDDAHRSGGTGAALLQAAEAFTIESGCAQMELSSSVARSRAHQFYEREGYREKRLRFVKTLVQ